MKIKNIDQIKNLREATVLVRVDFNVPLMNGKVKEDFKLKTCLSFIESLIKSGAKVILMSHLGEPKLTASGRVKPLDKKNYSLDPIAKALSKLLKRKVKFSTNAIGSKSLYKEVALMKSQEIILLENLRFYAGETSDDNDFSNELASLADIYVNNAFAVSHRKHASVSGVKKYLPSYAGPLLAMEIVNLSKVLKPKKPLVAIIGGAKIDTKVNLVKRLAKKADWLIVGGALANNFIAAKGYEIGKSLASSEGIKIAKKLLRHNILLPVDLVVEKTGQKKAIVKKLSEVNPDEMIFDIGPETMKTWSKIIKSAQTIIWNGPMGKFEDDRFRFGTMFIARSVASRASGRAFAVVGGGETVEAVNLSNSASQIDWISTGGGASLSYLSGENMPGLKGLIK